MASNCLKIAQQALKILTESKGFDRVIRNMKVTSASQGKCVCELTVDESHLNRGGALHGGLMATLVDDVSTLAILTANKHPGVSVDMNISYMKAAKVGDILEIKSDCLKLGKALAFANVNIMNKSDGSIIASGRQTKYIDF